MLKWKRVQFFDSVYNAEHATQMINDNRITLYTCTSSKKTNESQTGDSKSFHVINIDWCSSWVFWCTWHTTDSHRRTLVTPWRQSVADQLVDDCVLLTQLATWCQGHVLNWRREHSAFPVHWSGILSLSHCGLLIVSQLFVAGLRLTF